MAKFTHQHYKAIAELLAKHVGIERYVDGEETLDLLSVLATDFCVLFEADNPNFDLYRFLEACQIKE